MGAVNMFPSVASLHTKQAKPNRNGLCHYVAVENRLKALPPNLTDSPLIVFLIALNVESLHDSVRKGLHESLVLRLFVVSQVNEHPVKHLMAYRFPLHGFAHILVDSDIALEIIYLPKVRCVRVETVLCFDYLMRDSADVYCHVSSCDTQP